MNRVTFTRLVQQNRNLEGYEPHHIWPYGFYGLVSVAGSS